MPKDFGKHRKRPTGKGESCRERMAHIVQSTVDAAAPFVLSVLFFPSTPRPLVCLLKSGDRKSVV